ncbi:MAG: CsgG/HfaB family protein [Cyanobacteria bacterium P01_E01_bin.42]
MNFLKHLLLIPMTAGAALVAGDFVSSQFTPNLDSPAVAQNAQPKIVVLEFEAANASRWYSSYRGVGAARGISERLINTLVNNGTYALVDSSQIGESDRWWYSVDLSEALAAAHAKGIDAVVDGTVTQFEVEEKRICVGALVARVCNEEFVATVEINARIIDPENGSILATAEVEEEVKASNASGSVSGISGSSQGAEDDLLAEAVEAAVQELAEEIVRAQRKL